MSGIWGHPFIDLERYLDTSPLDAIDDEICLGLTQVPLEYTGGSHRTMGIVPPSQLDEPYVDYGEVIAGFSHDEFVRFVSLSDAPGDFDAAVRGDVDYREFHFGEEQENPLSRRQMLFLKFKYGVYFPWQVFYEMIPTLNWADKSTGQGKDFTREAKLRFPKLVAYVKSLPFVEVGRCNILGLEADHHGTIHQDGDIDDDVADQFITLCPRKNKRLYLWDEARLEKTFVESRAYWFNDHGYHGVEADPWFRYSVRIDGVFEPGFLARVRREWGG